MWCPQCQTENKLGRKFCSVCGQTLPVGCGQCGFVNDASDRFCGGCGIPLVAPAWPVVSSQSSVVSPQPPASYTPPHLAERIRAEQTALEARGVTDGERKSITALFADIKGSTDLIADLDPEEARLIIDPTLQLMMDAVHRYEGYVAQALGDGIFALFGAPIAHEDHPQRALYAALLMQEENRKRAEQLRREKGINLQIRVGVNTGEVVLRSIRKDDLHTDYVPVGQSTNLASRMESLATPGSILVSEQTYKLTEGYFEFKALGQAQVKGFAEPLNIYEVTGVGPLRTKLQLSVRRGLARFVGRQPEMVQLQQAWESAKAGHGQIVGAMGEPGVGKSRLFYEFKLQHQQGRLVLETFSVSHGKAYPYLPLVDLLRNYFQLTPHDDERRRREKITGKVLTLDRGLEDTLPYLFFLLSIAEPTSPLQQMDSQIRRKRILEALKRLLVRESLNQPLLIIFEDLHWLDAETQAFLQLLSESIPTARILLLVNYRPEYQHSWSGKTYYTQLRLDPLGKEQAEEMLSALLDNPSLQLSPQRGEREFPRPERVRVRVIDNELSALKRFILDKTEGNPFFMEEIVQELCEQGMLTVGAHGCAPLPKDIHIPTTVQGVLTARMDRLPSEEKALLQTLAVIGREFGASLLRKVVNQPEAELLGLLSRLQANEFVYEQPAFPEVEYIFKHALTQEVAYNSLLLERRKVLHERTARAIEEVYRHRLEDHYSELAYHYSRSENTKKAVDYLLLAGQQAVQRSAYTEAISHFTTALKLLDTFPDLSERARKELSLLAALGVPMQATRGYGSPEAKRIYTRARELCQQVGETPQLSSVLWGMWVFYLARAEHQTARDLGHQLLALAQNTQDSVLFVEAHFTLADTLFHFGDFVSALEHADQGFSCYDPQRYRTTVFTHGYEFVVISECYAAWSLWTLGYADQARKRMREALTLAQELSHSLTLGVVLAFAADVYRYCGERQIARERAEMGIALCIEYGFLYWSSHGIVTKGWDLAKQGQKEEGVSRVQEGLTLLQETGVLLDRPYYLALLAEMHLDANETEKGLAIVAEALAELHEAGERFEAELYRLKGELTLQKLSVVSSPLSVPNTQPLTPSTQEADEAEGYFLKAIDLARKQQAKSLELRATTSLARLWQQQGNYTEAHQMLSEVYNWFTEGFDTEDLQEAKTLIKELSLRFIGK